MDGARLRLLERAPTSSLNALLVATLDVAEELTGSVIGFFHFVDDDQTTLHLQAWSTNTVERMCRAEGTGSHYSVDKAGIWADCVRTGRPVVHNDYASAPGRKGMPGGHAAVVRELTVPVVRAGRVVAALGVGNKPTDYDDRDVADVSALADLAWDIAARKRAEEALTRSEARLRALFESMMDGLVVVDMAGHVVESNEVYRRMLGYDAAELRALTYRDLTPERWHAAEERLVAEQILPRGYSDVYEKEYRRKDGTVFPVELRTFLIEEDGRPAAMWAIVRDVTERRKADEALRQSERRFRVLASELGVGVFQADATGRLLFVNPAWRRLTGCADGEPLARVGQVAVHPEDGEGVARQWGEALAEGKPFAREYRLQRPDGTVVWARTFASPVRDATGAVAGFVGAVVDMTETRQLQAQVALSSRLASMGTLVAGVAHEVNNPLAAGMADQGIALEIARDLRARLLSPGPIDRRSEARQLDDAIEALEEAQESSARIARIVKNLTTFGRPDPRRHRVRLGDVVTEAMRWLPPSVGHVAMVQVDDGGAPDVVASAGQLEQVVVNLVTNGAKAMPQDRRGLILVRLGPGSPGMARLEVVDQGKGIAAGLVDRIFDPFFTTRPAGADHGMGLGLSICHAIVTSHGGTISVRTELGRGSTFQVELPAAPESA
ncbi:MAG TPA: PAS domain S-box protein [Anaeromyxobacteraceae bacterium]|nr:PAS domain S-box protein [Anaeromyxobacteraceae bacterium]